MDLCVYAKDHGFPIEVAADAVGLTPAQMMRAYQIIEARREAARYLHMSPILDEAAAESA